MNNNPTIQMISLENIIPNRFQPRIAFDEKALQELAASIKEHGVIQPLVLRQIGDKYEIIAGERRYKASTIAGLTEVPAIISNFDDNKSAEIALVENIQRKDLTSIEEAKSYKKILDKGILNQEGLAQKMGVSQSTIANKLRLLNLNEKTQEALLNHKISERHARSLLQLENQEEQEKMLDKVINDRLTVRQLDHEIKEILNNIIVEESDEVEVLDLNPVEQKFELPDIFNIFDQTKRPSLEKEEVNLSTENIFDTPTYTNELENPFTSEPESTNKPELVLEPILEEPVVEVKQTIESNDFKTVIEAYKNLAKEVKNAQYKITTEEFDFEDLYQIIIKIEKDV